jgi:Arc/MetJ family transcription regulator
LFVQLFATRFLDLLGMMRLVIASRQAYTDANFDALEGLAMRTTLTLDDDLLAKATELTGVEEKSALLRESLKALIERESARRLAKLGGSEKNLTPAPRRSTSVKS